MPKSPVYRPHPHPEFWIVIVLLVLAFVAGYFYFRDKPTGTPDNRDTIMFKEAFQKL